MTTETLINCLSKVFSSIGVAKIIVTDNARMFTSAEFNKYCTNLGIRHITSPPYHPSSNGSAENAVRIFKKSFNKILGDKSNKSKKMQELLDIFLYSYRNTIQETTKRHHLN